MNTSSLILTKSAPKPYVTRNILCSLGLLWLAGCATPEPNYHPPQFQPFMQDYEEKGKAPALPSSPASAPSQEITPAPARPPVITLADAIEECLRHNLVIMASTEDVNQAKADLWTATILPNPTLTMDAVLQPFHSLSRYNPAGPPEYDAPIQYPIDWLLFGKRAAKIKVAKQAVNAAAAIHADQIRQQVAAAISSFYDVLQAKTSLMLAQDDLRQYTQFQEIIAKRAGNGGGNLELDQLRTQLTNARQAVELQQRALIAVKSTLRTLLGRENPDQSFDVAGMLEVPAKIPPLEINALLRLARENRPDLLALKYKREQAEADISNQKVQGKPQVAVSLGTTLQLQAPNGQQNTMEWSAALQTTLPIFDRNQGNVRKARSIALQSKINYEAQVAQARLDIEQALTVFCSAYNVLAENGATLIQSAKIERDKLQKSYELGGHALIDVLNAQAAYRDALRQDLAQRLDYWRALHKLNAVVGTQILP